MKKTAKKESLRTLKRIAERKELKRSEKAFNKLKFNG